MVIIKRCFKSATLQLMNKYYLLAACETAIQQKNNTKVCKCFMLPDNKKDLDAEIYEWLGPYLGGRLWCLCRKSTISTYRALVNGRHCTKTVNFFRAYFKINPTKDLNSNQKLGVKLKPNTHTHTDTDCG